MTANFAIHDDETVTIRGERFGIYLDREQIAERVAELGETISRDYAGQKPILIGVLNGAFMFLSDLMKEISIDCEVDFLKLSSYGDSKISSGVVRELKKIDADLEDRHVIVVEDIVDSGITMDYIMRNLAAHKPASLKAATLLHKPDATKIDIPLEYVGFAIDNLFVVGYGLDYGQIGRNLADIYMLQPKDGEG